MAHFIFQQELNNFFARVERPQIAQAQRLDGHLDDVLLRNTDRAVLLLQVILARLNEHTLGDESHYLCTRDANTTVLCAAANLVEGLMQRCNINIGNVHGHLGNTVFINIPANGLRTLQRAWLHDDVAVSIAFGRAGNGVALTNRTSLLTNIEGNGISPTGRGSIQIIIDGNKEIARTHHGTTRP